MLLLLNSSKGTLNVRKSKIIPFSTAFFTISFIKLKSVVRCFFTIKVVLVFIRGMTWRKKLSHTTISLRLLADKEHIISQQIFLPFFQVT
jgi:hypothetical protein